MLRQLVYRQIAASLTRARFYVEVFENQGTPHSQSACGCGMPYPLVIQARRDRPLGSPEHQSGKRAERARMGSSPLLALRSLEPTIAR